VIRKPCPDSKSSMFEGRTGNLNISRPIQAAR